MTPALSVYLNLLRFCAALAVYLFHAQHFAKASFPWIGQLGDEAVIVFFVLSGMLITFSGMKQPELVGFMSARLARLWSVALPALALTLVVDMAGQYLAPASYHPMQPYSAFKWVASIGINALFVNQIWNLNVYPGTNGPFWSLSYEFWYYVAFAGFVYFKGAKRVLVLAACAVLAGPLITSGFPIWLMGVFLYFAIDRIRTADIVHCWIYWYGSFVIAGIGVALHLHQHLVALFPALATAARWSVNFIPESYLIGLLMVANIYGFALAYKNKFPELLKKNARMINSGADISFGLYLFHYPLMYFFRAVFVQIGITEGTVFVVALYTLPFIASAALSLYCEKQKGAYLRGIRKIMATVGTAYRQGGNRLAGQPQLYRGGDIRMQASPSVAQDIHSKKL